MKKTSCLLIFVSALLIGSLAGAATLAPESPVFMTSASPAAPSPFCFLNAPPVDLAAGKKPLPVKASICGACSDTICRGQTLGAICRTGNPFYRCQNVYGNFCPQDGLSSCQCWNRPLP